MKTNNKPFRIINIIKLLFIVFLLFLSFSCSDEPPEVMVKNQSKLTVDVSLIIVNCSCPSVSFIDISPFSETPYREITKDEYEIRIKTFDIIDENKIRFRSELNKKYQINIDSVLNCKVEEFDR